ncbi:MAG: leucyl/phenylalanyl-tRNA--protein transferase [Bacteroidales bacterium]
MPIFQLSQDLIFPDPELSEEDGLLAIGGDLSPERLILAYSQGIFPWFNEGDPILWWSLNPRLILFPDEFKCSASLLRKIKSHQFEVKFDTNFEAVIKNCSYIERKDQEYGSWITQDMITAYTKLHHLGFAHSVETYYNGQLVGGLYGIIIGKVFVGESMFHNMTDASKFALYHLVETVKKQNFHFIDAQQPTAHLISMGAREINRKQYLILLKNAVKARRNSVNINPLNIFSDENN